MEAVGLMAVEAVSMVEVDSTVAEDLTEVVGSMVAVGFTARAASEAAWDLAAAAGFVAARSEEERDFAEVRSAVDFVVAIAFAAAFVATASAAAGAGADEVGEDEVGAGEVGIGTIGASVSAGAGLMDIGPDTRIPTGMGTTPGGLRPTTVFLLMIPTMILTIHTILTTTRHLHTRIGLTRIGIATAGTRILHRRALQ
jgi:hypothetical protein